jgi:hypothetical protein
MTFWTDELIEGVPGYVFWPLLLLAIAAAIYVALRFSRKQPTLPVRSVAGSRVALAVGDHFSPSNRYTGFLHEESGASIIMMEMSHAAFDQLRQLEFASESFARQGMSNIEAQPLPGRQGDYLYLRAEQKTPLVDYAKYILIFRDAGSTAMVTANIPRAALTSGMIAASEIESIFRSAQMLPKEEQAAPEPFSLPYLGPFEEDLTVLGTAKGYRLAGGKDSGSVFKPVFLVAPSLTAAPIPNLQLFAERSFHSIDQIAGKEIETASAIQVDRLNAIEMAGRGIDRKTNVPVFIYQLIVEVRTGGYFRILGLAPERERALFEAEFIKMGRGLRAGRVTQPREVVAK